MLAVMQKNIAKIKPGRSPLIKANASLISTQFLKMLKILSIYSIWNFTQE